MKAILVQGEQRAKIVCWCCGARLAFLDYVRSGTLLGSVVTLDPHGSDNFGIRIAPGAGWAEQDGIWALTSYAQKQYDRGGRVKNREASPKGKPYTRIIRPPALQRCPRCKTVNELGVDLLESPYNLPLKR